MDRSSAACNHEWSLIESRLGARYECLLCGAETKESAFPVSSAATVEQRLATRLACPHKHTYVKRTPPTWATDPYPAVITEECEDCGKLVAVTNVERPKS